MSALLEHWPHLLPIGFALAAVVYLWRTGPPPTDSPRSPRRKATATRWVERETARRGLLVLGPMLGAIATGVVLYAFALGGVNASVGWVGVHVGVSIAVCALAVYKLGGGSLFDRERHWSVKRAVRRGGSLLVAALLVPLLVTGVLLLLWPSTSSYPAYLHLIAAAWWTLLVGWHLARFLMPSLLAVKADADSRRGRSDP